MTKTTILDSMTDFARRHKTAITVVTTVTATTAACIVLNKLAANSMVEFIKEKNLWDEYLSAGEE